MGAGCAGLTCAEELRERGYRNVTLYEAQNRAGGKIRSVTYDPAPAAGRGLFEAGTVFFIPSPMWTKLLRRYRVAETQTQMAHIRIADVSTGTATVPINVSNGHSLGRRLREVVQLMRLVDQHGRAHERRPGVAPHVTPELCAAAKEWFGARGLSYVRDVVLPIVGAAQFGPLIDKVPAIYVIRLLAMLRRYPVAQHLRNAMPQLRAGHETLWTKVAATHQVRYGDPIRRIDLNGRVTIDSDSGRDCYDALIVAAPMQAYSAANLGLDPHDRELLSQVQTLDREVITARVTGLPRDLFYAPRYRSDGVIPRSHPYLFYEVDRGSNLYTFHPYAEPGSEPSEIESAIRSVVARFGGRLEQIEHRAVVRGWFPHFSETALRAGAYQRLEAMQGRNNVWFAGELLAGIGVPHGMEYAAALVGRMTSVSHA